MMLNLPATPPEADTARSPKPHATAAEPGNPEESGHPFALLLAADSLVMIPPESPAPVSPEDAEAFAALLAEPQDGKILPPVGELLPPGQFIRAPAPGDANAAVPGTESLNRMLGMLRMLQGNAGVEGEEGLLPRPELKVAELTESSRLAGTLSATLQTAQVTAPPAMPALSAATPTAAAAPPSLPIAVAPGRADWSDAVGQRVLWMVANKSQVAELRLNPPELGPVEVKVRTDEDGVRLSFAAGNAAVREALEAAAPRLREMFLAEGLRLENMDIGQQHAGAGREGEPDAAGVAGSDAGEDDAEQGVHAAAGQRLGLVDCFV
jgi:flagellar hook-length control protein FliK